MREYTAVEVEGIARNELRSDLEKLLREGARQMLEVALQTEVAEYTERHQGERDDAHGRRLVVRNGFHPPRATGHRSGQSTGAAATGRRPARGSGVHQRYSTPVCPASSQHRRLGASVLYLKGISTSSFPEALKAILGDQVSGLSPANIVRLKQGSVAEAESCHLDGSEDLSGTANTPHSCGSAHSLVI